MKTWLLMIVFAANAISLLPTTAIAEIVIAESVEWALAQSDRVLIGKVVATEQVIDDNKQKCEVVTIKVSQVLKGEKDDRVKFVVPSFLGAVATLWLKDETTLVFCLVKNDEKRLPLPAEKYKWVLRDDGNHANAIPLEERKDKPSLTRVFARDYRALTDVDAIRGYIESTIKESAAGNTANSSYSIKVPYETAAFQELWAGSAVYLKVPVDAKLESLARQWCESDEPVDRAEGARVLGRYEKDKNAEILENLLRDPSWKVISEAIDGQLVSRKKSFFVRKAAYEVLTQWGVKVERPVLDEPN